MWNNLMKQRQQHHRLGLRKRWIFLHSRQQQTHLHMTSLMKAVSVQFAKTKLSLLGDLKEKTVDPNVFA